MRKTTIILLTLLALVLIGCGSPPEDVPRAEVNEEPVANTEVPAEAAEEVEVDPESLEAEMEALPDEDSEEKVKVSVYEFEFEGYKPGGSHAGTFSEGEGFLHYTNGVVSGASGVIQAASVSTGIAKLDDHLKNDDFFDVERCPTIEFESTSMTSETMTGQLQFHCETHEVTFPVTVEGSTLSADFMLDTTPFNFKHTGVNKEVRISLMMSS